MKTFALTLALVAWLALAAVTPVNAGWIFYTFGYFDHDGAFILDVQRSDDQTTVPDLVTCETLREAAEQRGWLVLPRCVNRENTQRREGESE